MKRRDCLTLALCAPLALHAASPRPGQHWREDRALYELLAADPGPARDILDHPRRYELQAIWTRIERRGDTPLLAHHTWNLRPRRWFAAASLVKLPIALFTMERLAELGYAERWSSLRLRLSEPPDCARSDATGSEGVPLPELLRSLLIVSDNPAFNRLLDWLGWPWVAQRLEAMGYGDARIVNRLMHCGPDAQSAKAGVELIDAEGQVLHRSPAAQLGPAPPFPYGRATQGRAWLEQGRLIEGARDFSRANFLPLAHAHNMLIALVMPEAVIAAQRWRIEESQRRWLYETLGMLPSESPAPRFPASEFPDHYAKFLVVGGRAGQHPPGLRIHNKIGEAFGYLSDVAYLKDSSGAECFLSAVVYVNSDGVLNDGAYDYEQLGRPFLAHLGQLVLAAERRARRAT